MNICSREKTSNVEQQATPSSPRIGRAKFLTIALCFLLLSTLVFARLTKTATNPFRSVTPKGTWIRPSGPLAASGYFRKRFDVTSPVRHAWIAVSAKDAFEISVNQNPVGQLFLWRPTRPFQNGLSEKGQAVSHQKSAMALNFPREYQWQGHENWKFPVYFDFTKQMKMGRNVVCLEIESRSVPATANFWGQITLWNGKVIPIKSDESWHAEPVPPGIHSQDWTQPNYQDLSWRHAVAASGPSDSLLRTAPEPIFTTPLNSNWIRSADKNESRATRFMANWEINGRPDEAWIRLVANRRHQVFINGHRVDVGDARPIDIDQGNWVLGKQSGFDSVSNPELLDPDEVGDFFGGEKFKNPRDAQADLEEFIKLKPKTHLPFRNYKTTNRAEDGGEFDPTRTLAESRSTPAKPDLPAQMPIHNSLKRDRAVGSYFAYSVRKLVHHGTNKIEIKCEAEPNFNWKTAIAIDGAATSIDGQTSPVPAPFQWATQSATHSKPISVEVLALANSQVNSLPSLTYRGQAKDPIPNGKRFWSAFQFLSLVGLVVSALWFAGLRVVGQSASPKKSSVSFIALVLLVTSVTMFCGLLVESSLRERFESVFFLNGSGWWLVVACGFGCATLAGITEWLGRMKLTSLQANGHRLTHKLYHLPDTRCWPFLILWVLLLCVLLRGYKLDLQPLDDDEYASTQAIMAILDTGAPAFVPDNIYYTRSPLFHYFTAAVAYPFGGNLWSLRLQSVLWSAATALLVYFFGSRLLNSKWIGFGAMVLLSIHPFQVFTGHVIRFYQMQQFFALLTVYLFCFGFVTHQKQSYRIATLLVYLAAVLAQEISAVMGLPLVLGYLIFAKDLGWKKNIELLLVAAAVVIVIAVDLVAFKTLCLTRTEGVSPTIEAAIKPHFWYPLNFFSIFIGYSRLHVIPSCFFFIGLPLIWRERNRNAIALVYFLFSGVVMTNILVSHVSLRYQYWLFPIWMLASLVSIRLVTSTMVEWFYQPQRNLNRFVFSMTALSTIIMTSIVVSWSPMKMLNSYESSLLGESTGCVRWVKSQMRDDDKLAITEPHTHSGFLEAGKVDYDIAVPLLYDFAVKQKGKLVDRNGGGEVIGSLDGLLDVFERNERVWILINREKFRTRGKNLRWEYPGARFEKFVRKNCELKYRSYLWYAYLWDPANGHFVGFQKQQ